MSSLIITATYNIVDSLFVGRFVGTDGLAAVGSNFPLFILLIAMGILVGTGASALISRNFGEEKPDEANRVFANALTLIAIISGIVMLIFVPFTEFWVALIGSPSSYAIDYFFIIALGAPFVIFNLALNNMVYAEGNGRIGFTALTCTSVLNIILDWFFITQLNMAVAGAAIATLISQASGTTILLVYFFLPYSQLKIRLRFSRERVFAILRIGFPAAARTFSVVFLGLIMNLSALRVGGEIALAVVSVVFRTVSLIALPAFGINQAFLPIASFNYGAQKFDRVHRVTLQAVLLSLGICYGFVVFTWIFAPQLAASFNPNTEFVALATEGFRIVFLGTPLLIFNLVSSGLYQALGKPARSLVVAISRIVFFKLPLIAIFSALWGVTGIWTSLLLSELLSTLFSAFMAVPALRSLMKHQINSTA